MAKKTKKTIKRTGPSSLISGRLARCRRLMKKHRVAALLISKPRDAFYLIGFTGEDSAVLVLAKEVHLISDGRFDESINQECPWVTRWMRKGLLNAEIAKVCKSLKIRRLAVQADGLSVADHRAIDKLAGTTKLTDAPPILEDMRCLKDEHELQVMQRAIKVAQQAFLAMRKSIRVGQTELELAARLEYEMKKRGSSRPAFPTICAEGRNGALPHAHPGSRKVKRGSAILFDWGARVGEYCSDLTRMVFVGSIPPKMSAVYDVVLEAQKRAIKAIKPGRRMCDVDAVARYYIIDAGDGQAFNHGLGHGLGLDVHESPSLSWRSDQKLRVGMVVTVEPGVYLPGIGGVRIEDDVLVTSNGCRVLSTLNKTKTGSVI